MPLKGSKVLIGKELIFLPGCIHPFKLLLHVFNRVFTVADLILKFLQGGALVIGELSNRQELFVFFEHSFAIGFPETLDVGWHEVFFI